MQGYGGAQGAELVPSVSRKSNVSRVSIPMLSAQRTCEARAVDNRLRTYDPRTTERFRFRLAAGCYFSVAY